jgi:ABC-type multidrug transport system ATPase subunit
VINTLKTLTESGVTVIVSIHQPRSSIVNLFDHLIILASGKIVYNDENKKAVDYFANLGYKCPPGFNSADYFLDIVSMNYRSEEQKQESLKRVLSLSL